MGSKVESSLSLQQHFLALYAVRVGHATIYWADCRTLGLFVEAHALRAFIWHDVVVFVGYGRVFAVSIHRLTRLQRVGALHSVAIGNGPFYTAFVDGVVGAFWLAGPAIDAFVSDKNCHSTCLLLRPEQATPPKVAQR